MRILTSMLIILGVWSTAHDKIAVIDAQKVIQKSKKGLAVQRELEAMQANFRIEIEDRQSVIKNLEKELMSPTLNNEVREQKGRELQEKRVVLQRHIEDAQAQMQRETQKRLQELERDIIPIIQSLGKSMGYAYIVDLNRSGFVYVDDSIDITQELINQLDNP